MLFCLGASVPKEDEYHFLSESDDDDDDIDDLHLIDHSQIILDDHDDTNATLDCCLEECSECASILKQLIIEASSSSSTSSSGAGNNSTATSVQQQEVNDNCINAGLLKAAVAAAVSAATAATANSASSGHKKCNSSRNDRSSKRKSSSQSKTSKHQHNNTAKLAIEHLISQVKHYHQQNHHNQIFRKSTSNTNNNNTGQHSSSSTSSSSSSSSSTKFVDTNSSSSSSASSITSNIAQQATTTTTSSTSSSSSPTTSSPSSPAAVAAASLANILIASNSVTNTTNATASTNNNNIIVVNGFLDGTNHNHNHQNHQNTIGATAALLAKLGHSHLGRKLSQLRSKGTEHLQREALRKSNEQAAALQSSGQLNLCEQTQRYIRLPPSPHSKKLNHLTSLDHRTNHNGSLKKSSSFNNKIGKADIDFKSSNLKNSTIDSSEHLKLTTKTSTNNTSILGSPLLLRKTVQSPILPQRLTPTPTTTSPTLLSSLPKTTITTTTTTNNANTPPTLVPRSANNPPPRPKTVKPNRSSSSASSSSSSSSSNMSTTTSTNTKTNGSMDQIISSISSSSTSTPSTSCSINSQPNMSQTMPSIRQSASDSTNQCAGGANNQNTSQQQQSSSSSGQASGTGAGSSGTSGGGGHHHQHQQFINKPPRGWLHPDHKLTDTQDGHGVTYTVRYIGCLGVNTSMKSLDFQTRSLIAKESINRVCEAAGLKTVDKKRRVDRRIAGMLADTPNMEHAGVDANLSITISYLTLKLADTGEPLAKHEMPNISFASGGDTETLDFAAYVAKDSRYDRACFVLECEGGRAQEVITTIGQAFELRFNEFLKRNPLSSERFDSVKANTNTNTNHHFNGHATSTTTQRIEDREYYNDLPGKIPPDINLNGKIDVLDQSTASTSTNRIAPLAAPRTSTANKKSIMNEQTNAGQQQINLIDLNDDNSSSAINNSGDNVPNNSSTNSSSSNNNTAFLAKLLPTTDPQYVNCMNDNKASAAVLNMPTTSTDRDPFDMQPFNNALAVHVSSNAGSSLSASDSNSNSSKPSTSTQLEYVLNSELCKEEWFHGPISRKDSETLVIRDGDFLVRESQQSPGQYVLTGMQGGCRKHLLLVDPEGVVRTKDKTFESVSHLINYHRHNGLPIISAESALVLKNPIMAKKIIPQHNVL